MSKRIALEALQELERVLAFPVQVTDAEIPDDWPSVNCENPGHMERQEFAAWRCPDCFSSWWAVNGDPQPAENHIQAFIYGALRAEAGGE